MKLVPRMDGSLVARRTGRGRVFKAASAVAFGLVAVVALQLRRRLRVARAYPFFPDWLRFSRRLKTSARGRLVRLGSDFAGYAVPDELPRSDWICYSGGIGEDASFDLELIKRYGCTVYAFDPTPRGREVGRLAAREAHFRFLPYGLWSEDTKLKFYAPRDPSHNAYSIPNLQGTSSYVLGDCRTLSSLMAELGHDHIDLLKLDIEGAEYAVLDSMRAEGISVKVLLIVFHKLSTVREMIRAVEKLQAEGYEPVHVEKTKVTFINPRREAPRRAGASSTHPKATTLAY
jgi:FkbM family methyltransferase